MQNLTIKIHRVSTEDVIDLRHKYLRSGKPIEECYWEHDSDLSTIHLGAFVNDHIVGVLSLCIEANPIFKQETQLRARGLAVDVKFRGFGVASQLVMTGINYAKQRSYDLIWANARPISSGIFEGNGFSKVGHSFQLHNISEHSLYVKFLR